MLAATRRRFGKHLWRRRCPRSLTVNQSGNISAPGNSWSPVFDAVVLLISTFGHAAVDRRVRLLLFSNPRALRIRPSFWFARHNGRPLLPVIETRRTNSVQMRFSAIAALYNKLPLRVSPWLV